MHVTTQNSPFATSSTGGESLIIVAPLSGIIVPLERVPDPAFAERLVGDGVSIDPMSDRVLAPCDARVLQVHRAHHAVTLSARGLEIIIHVGLDTVMLNGEGFTALVKGGDMVRTGDPLLSFDADLVARRARSLLTQIIVANVENVARIEPSEGFVTAGRDTLMRIHLTEGTAAPYAQSQSEAVRSRPIVITASGGLHARPAAMITTVARRFTSDVRLLSGSREANARSVVSIMALEVGQGDEVTIVATGSDARRQSPRSRSSSRAISRAKRRQPVRPAPLLRRRPRLFPSSGPSRERCAACPRHPAWPWDMCSFSGTMTR